MTHFNDPQIDHELGGIVQVAGILGCDDSMSVSSKEKLKIKLRVIE